MTFVCRDLAYACVDRFQALQAVSVDVVAGRTAGAAWCANGCGKSALLKVLDGLVHPTSGTFHAFGELLTEDNLEDEPAPHRRWSPSLLTEECCAQLEGKQHGPLVIVELSQVLR